MFTFLFPHSDENKTTVLLDQKLFRNVGVDLQGRQVYALFACYVPSAQEHSYDVLLKGLVKKLESFSESEYTLILFSGGATHYPSWSWTIGAYSRFSRSVKKNLKALYIVHPSTWPKFVFSSLGLFISPKFAKKLFWMDTVALLIEAFPLAASIDLPEEILRIDAAHTPSLSRHSTVESKVFGRSLDSLMGPDGSGPIPKVILDTMAYIEKNGLLVEGLFRKSASVKALQDAKKAYDHGQPFVLEDIHVACGLLKSFFRELPSPLFKEEIYPVLRGVESAADKIYFITHSVLPLLTPATIKVLKEVFKLLHYVSLLHAQNMMTTTNLTIVWSPNFVRGSDPMADLNMCSIGSQGGGIGTVMSLCIDSHESIFFTSARKATLKPIENRPSLKPTELSSSQEETISERTLE